MDLDMKKIFLIFTSLLFITSTVFPQSKMNIKYLDEYGGKKFKQNDDKPFTGIVFDLSKETGNKISETKYVKGVPHGKHIEWNNDGKKTVDGKYKHGKKDGLSTFWYENGQKEEGNYTDGKKNGTWMHWDLNGSKILDEKFENGILNGPMISWYPNGQKEMVILWENGKKRNLEYWNENGEAINISPFNSFPIMELLDGKRALETLQKSE